MSMCNGRRGNASERLDCTYDRGNQSSFLIVHIKQNEEFTVQLKKKECIVTVMHEAHPDP